MTNLTNQTLGAYDLAELLGEGPQAHVYRARRAGAEHDCAIKLFRPQVVARPGFAERMHARAAEVAALDHPHIAVIAGAEESEQGCWLAMELFEAGSLRGLTDLPDGSAEPLALSLALDLIRQAALGLAEAHAAGILHLNLKPSNLLIALAADESAGLFGYTLRVADFGIIPPAELERDDPDQIAPDTRIYALPPEHYRSGQRGLDARADIYALGAILYEAVTGEPPFDSPVRAHAIAYHLYEEPRPPHELRPDLPVSLEAIILRCLAKNPDERFGSAAELATALQEELHALLAPAAPVGPAVIAPALPAPKVRVFYGQVRQSDYDLSSDGLTIGQHQDNTIVLPRLADRQLVIDWNSYQASVTNLDGGVGVRVGGVPLPPQAPRPWNWNESLRTGPYLLCLLKPDGLPEAPLEEAEVEIAPAIATAVGEPAGGESARLEIRPTPDILPLIPGEEARIQIEIENRSPVIEGLTLAVAGEDIKPEWFRGLDEKIYLGKGEKQTRELIVKVPATADIQARNYQATFRVQSLVDQGYKTTNVTLNVLPFAAATLDVRPKRRRARLGAQYTIYLRNAGNAPETYRLLGEDDPQLLDCDPLEPQVQLKPGQARPIKLVVRPRERRWFGASETHTFSVRAITSSGEGPQPVTVLLEQQSIIPRWLIVLVALVIALPLFWNYMNRFNSAYDPRFSRLPLYGILNPTPSHTPTATITPTPTTNPTLVAILVGGVSPAPTPTLLPTITPEPTITPLPTATPTPTETPTPTATPTLAPTSDIEAQSAICARGDARIVEVRGGDPGSPVELRFGGRRVDQGINGNPNEKFRVGPDGRVEIPLTIGDEADGTYVISIVQDNGRVLKPTLTCVIGSG